VIGPPPLEAVTVTVAIPLFPSLVAVIVATPAAAAVTNPLPLTAAAGVLLLAHVTARPVSTFPTESFVVADNWTVPPTGRLATAGVTATDATGTTVTVTVAIPLFPSLVAVIVATPAATAVTSPLPLVAATAVLLLAHVTVRPVSTFPAESFVVADNWTVPPTGRLATAGVTSTDATGTAVTVTVALAAFPPG